MDSTIQAIGRLLIRTGVANWVKFEQGDYSLRLCPGTSHRWLTPIGVRPVEEFFRRYVKPGDVVIDAGANVGIFTLVSAVAATPAGRVYSIEAHPRTFQFLRKHLDDNKMQNVVAINLALGDRGGMLYFSDSFFDDDINHVSSTGIPVPVQRLDALVQEPRVDLLKVDVEGYEKFTLDGATGLLPGVQCMLVEVEEDKCLRFGYTSRNLLDLIESHGFTILRVSGDAAARVPAGFVPRQPEDLVAVRSTEAFLQRTGYRLRDIPLSVPSFRTVRAAA